MTVGTDIINFDQALDMSDSTAFSQGYIDWMNRNIYLVFENGTVVSRMLDADFEREDADNMDSWGSFWWSEMKDWWLGPTIDSNPTFQQRPATPASWNLTGQANPTVSMTVGTSNTTFYLPQAELTLVPEEEQDIEVDDLDEQDIEEDALDDDDVEVEEDGYRNSVTLTLYANDPDEIALIMEVLLKTSDFVHDNFDVAVSSVSSQRNFN